MKSTHTTALAAIGFTCLLGSCDSKKPATTGGDPSAPAQEKSAVATNVTDGSPHFSRVMNRLDVGGKMLQFQDHDGQREMVIEMANAMISIILPDQPEGQINVPAIIDASGLALAKASGRSLRKDGDAWLQRTYTYLPDERQGLTTLLGTESVKFRSPDILPASADLVLETRLDLTKIPGVIEKIAKACDEGDSAKMFLETKAPTGGKLKDGLAKMDLNLLVAMDISEWEAVPASVKPVDFFIRIEGGKYFVDQMLPQIEAGMGEPKTIGKSRAWEIPMEQVMQPKALVMIDEDSTVSFVSSEAYLKSIDGDAAKLSSDADFQSATNHFPKEGNLMVYLSPQVPPFVAWALRTVAAPQMEPEIAPFFEKATEYLEARPWSLCIANEADGTASTSEMPFALDENLTAALPLMAMNSTLFIGARAWKKGSDRAACILQTRNIQQAVRSYANMNNLEIGDPLPWDEIFGEDKFIEQKPVCPMGGTFTFSETIPEVGDLAGQCSHEDHRPENHDEW